MSDLLLPTLSTVRYGSHLPLRVNRDHPQLDGCIALWAPPLSPSVATLSDYTGNDITGKINAPAWRTTKEGPSVQIDEALNNKTVAITCNINTRVMHWDNWPGCTLIWVGYIRQFSFSSIRVRALISRGTSINPGRNAVGIMLQEPNISDEVLLKFGSNIPTFYGTSFEVTNDQLYFFAASWDATSTTVQFHYAENDSGLNTNNPASYGGTLSQSDNEPFYIGTGNDGGNVQPCYFIHGRVYDRFLTPAKILDIYNDLYAPFSLAIPETGVTVEAGVPPVIVPSVPEVGTGSDVALAPSADLQVTDSTFSLDDLAPGYPLAALSPIADTGATSDSTTPADASFIIYESSPATDDSLVVSIQFSIGDTATGADIIDVVGSTFNQVLDSGLGTDNAVVIHASIPMSDAGNSIDTASLIANIRVTDTMGSADVVDVLTEVLKIASDTGAGFDAINIPQACHDDFAFSVDTIPYPTVAVIIPDVGIASQEVINAIIQTIEIIDSATGADVVIPITASVIANDSGFGSDVSEIIQAFVTIAETAGADDVVIAFESGTRIARISFKLRRKRITFKLQ